MAGCRGLIFPTRIFNLLNVRTCLTTPYQYISSKIRKNIEKNILPPPPKKPLHPFFKYLQQVRPIVREEFPQLKMIDLVRKISERWKTDVKAQDQLRKEFNEEYQNYIKNLLTYQKSITDEQRQMVDDEIKKVKIQMEKQKYKQALEVFGKPKKPLGAFFLFLDEQRNCKDKNLKQSEWMKIMSKKWANLDPVEKQKFQDKSSEAMQKYNKEIKEWKEKLIKEGRLSPIKCQSLHLWTNGNKNNV